MRLLSLQALDLSQVEVPPSVVLQTFSPLQYSMEHWL